MNSHCAEPGCPKTIDRGDALYRVSPKGTPFVGKCGEHAKAVDPTVRAITEVFEESNRA